MNSYKFEYVFYVQANDLDDAQTQAIHELRELAIRSSEVEIGDNLYFVEAYEEIKNDKT